MERKFHNGNARLDRFLSNPERAAKVAAIREESERLDRIYAEKLAGARQAVNLTQCMLAERMGVNQSVISRVENQSDMLLSTLTEYLRAAGFSSIQVLAEVDGHEVELDLIRMQENA